MNCVEEIEFAFDEMLEMPELDEIAFLDCEEEAIVDPNQLATEDPYCACEQSTYWASQHEANCNDVNVIYWYHPDYLGSVEAITDVRGEVYQFFHNTIWGDRPLRNKPVACFREGASMPRRQQDQKAFTYKDFSSRFCFNLPAGRHGGKERDEETGNYYYGARYYDPKISVWLSVDPMAAKRTWLTPYNFVSSNPLLRVDPDGNLDICETCPNEPRFDEYRDSPVNYEFTPNGNGGGEIHVAYKQTLEEVNVSPTIGPQMVASNGNYNGFNLVTDRPGYLFGQGKETRKGEGKTINIDNLMLNPPSGNSLYNWKNVLPKAFDFVDLINKIINSEVPKSNSDVNQDIEITEPDINVPDTLYSKVWKSFPSELYEGRYELRPTGEIDTFLIYHDPDSVVKVN